MINFTVVTSYTNAMFDTLYADCSSDMDAGSYPWHLFPVSTEAEKKQHLKDAFNNAPFMFTVDEDGHYLMLNAGTITNGVFHWYLGLIGYDTGNSKAWLYRADYQAARNAFWPAQNITEWRVETMGSGTAMHDHMISARGANTIPGTFSSVEEDHVVLTQTELRFVV